MEVEVVVEQIVFEVAQQDQQDQEEEGVEGIMLTEFLEPPTREAVVAEDQIMGLILVGLGDQVSLSFVTLLIQLYHWGEVSYFT